MPGRNVIPWVIAGQKSRSTTCAMFAVGPKAWKTALFSYQVSYKRKVRVQPLPPRHAQSTHLEAWSWLCLLMLPPIYWVACTEIISLPVLPLLLLTLLLHNATWRAWVEYYIPERKGNTQAEKTRLQWKTLPFHHRALCVSADNRPLCSPIS